MVGQKRQLLLLLRQANSKAVVSRSLLLSYSAVEIAIKWRFYPLLLRLRNTRGLSPIRVLQTMQISYVAKIGPKKDDSNSKR